MIVGYDLRVPATGKPGEAVRRGLTQAFVDDSSLDGVRIGVGREFMQVVQQGRRGQRVQSRPMRSPS